VYGGSSNFIGSASLNTNQKVNLNPTTTGLTSSQNPSVKGSSVTFTATVSSGAPGGATGSVTFKDGSKKLVTVNLNGGQASFSTSALTKGSHSVTAQYGGDAANDSSTSTVVVQVVN
jgi:hypothetical protein